MKDKPCCAAAAAREIGQLKVDGRNVGIAYLDDILNEVKAKGLTNNETVGDALLATAKIHNYIPNGKQAAYRKALLDRYKEDR